MGKFRELSFVAAAFLIMSTADAVHAQEACEPSLSQLNAFVTTYQDAYTADDAAALGELMTEDAILMPPGEPDVLGAEAAAARYAQQFKAVDSTLTLTVREIRGGEFSGRALILADYVRSDVPRGGGDTLTVTGRLLWLMEQQSDESWKIGREIWNTFKTSGAEPEPAPAPGPTTPEP